MVERAERQDREAAFLSCQDAGRGTDRAVAAADDDYVVVLPRRPANALCNLAALDQFDPRRDARRGERGSDFLGILVGALNASAEAVDENDGSLCTVHVRMNAQQLGTV